jgi:hypothetical protein
MGTVDDITLELELNGAKDSDLSPGPFICGFVLGGDGLGAALRGVVESRSGCVVRFNLGKSGRFANAAHRAASFALVRGQVESV